MKTQKCILFMNKPWSYTGQTWCWTYYTLKIAKLSFFNFGPILSTKVRQWHFITEKCSSKDLRGGAFSTRFFQMFDVISGWKDKIVKIYCERVIKKKSRGQKCWLWSFALPRKKLVKVSKLFCLKGFRLMKEN